MSVWHYRDEAKGHVWEFVDLGFEREDDRKAVYAMALADPKKIETFIAEYQDLIIRLVEATPSRRLAMLRRMSGGDGPTQFVLILGAWQLCRKAVLAYDWLMDNDSHFTPGQAYRRATASQGRLFDQLKERRWTKWPFQWGKSPFPGEKARREPYEAPDFDEVMDNYDPRTGMY
jgi:hypothetical protein